MENSEQTLCWKLTTQDNYTRKGTYNACLWGPGVTHSGKGRGGLCSPGWVHAYTNPLLAILLNPTHANIKNPKLWEAVGYGKQISDKGLKIGFISITTIKEISIPVISDNQKIAFGILCAKEVCKNKEWNDWADKWLNKTARGNTTAANTAAHAVYNVYDAYDADVANAAAYAANAAANTAAHAVYNVYDAYDADVANAAADAAAYAANAAANTAVAYSVIRIDFIKIAQEAMQFD